MITATLMAMLTQYTHSQLVRVKCSLVIQCAPVYSIVPRTHEVGIFTIHQCHCSIYMYTLTAGIFSVRWCHCYILTLCSTLSSIRFLKVGQSSTMCLVASPCLHHVLWMHIAWWLGPTPCKGVTTKLGSPLSHQLVPKLPKNNITYLATGQNNLVSISRQ